MDPIDTTSRRARAQRLWSSSLGEPVEVLTHLLAVQSQEHRYARWSLAQRTERPEPSVVDRAFDDGRVLRTHVLRPTWHYVARDDLRWLMALSGPRLLARLAGRSAELGLPPTLLARTDALVADAVAGRPHTRKQIGDLLAREGIDGAKQRLPHILMHAELTGTVCSGPMSGTEHTYALFDERVPPAPAIERDEALERLATRYFTTRGPATLKDFMWWSGMAASDARRGIALAGNALQEETADGRTYWFGVEDAPRASGSPRATGSPRAGEPIVDLVQCYDEIIISYTQSRDVLHGARASFPVPAWTGGFAHVVLLDGQLLGHWRARRSEIETRIDARLSSDEQNAVTAAIQTAEAFFAERA